MIFAVAGSRFFVGSSFSAGIDQVSATDFASQAWVEVGGCESLGSSAETVTTWDNTHLGSTRGTIGKGVATASPMTLTVGVDAADAGQLALLAALRSPESFAFRIALSDGTTRMFLGLVIGAEEVLEAASDVARMMVTIARQTNLVRLP